MLWLITNEAGSPSIAVNFYTAFSGLFKVALLKRMRSGNDLMRMRFKTTHLSVVNPPRSLSAITYLRHRARTLITTELYSYFNSALYKSILPARAYT